MASPLRMTSESSGLRARLVEGFDIELLRADPVLADIARTAAEICRAPVAHVSLLDAQKQYVIAALGMQSAEVPIERTFCRVAVDSGQLLIVEDLSLDARFASHADVAGGAGYRFYAGLPVLLCRRVAIGTLCVLDFESRRLTIEQRAGLFGLLRQVELQLQSHLERATIEQLVVKSRQEDERANREIRDRKDMLSSHLISYAINQMASLKSDADFLQHNLRFGAQLHEMHEEALADLCAGVDEATTSLRNARALVQSPEGHLAGLPDISLAEMIEDVGRLFQERFGNRTGRVDLGYDVDAQVVGADPTLVRFALISLLHIALEFLPPEQAIEIGVYAVDGTAAGDERSPDASDEELEHLMNQLYGHEEPSDAESSRVGQVLEFCFRVAAAHGGRLVSTEHEDPDCFSVRFELPGLAAVVGARELTP